MSPIIAEGPGLQRFEGLRCAGPVDDDRKPYRLDVRLIREESGGFSVYLANLPGVVSEGDTEEEAVANIQEAFRAVIQSYQGDGVPIPWQESGLSTDDNEITKWLSAYA